MQLILSYSGRKTTGLSHTGSDRQAALKFVIGGSLSLFDNVLNVRQGPVALVFVTVTRAVYSLRMICRPININLK